MRRHVNVLRSGRWLGELETEWVVKIPGYKALQKAVKRDTTARHRADGTLFHHKHDLAPTPEQLEAMGRAALDADAHVAAAPLDALEAGMAVALYMDTGARGKELKSIHLQSLGHERVADADSGVLFDMLKLTAFETKTKLEHLNQLLAHALPTRVDDEEHRRAHRTPPAAATAACARARTVRTRRTTTAVSRAADGLLEARALVALRLEVLEEPPRAQQLDRRAARGGVGHRADNRVPGRTGDAEQRRALLRGHGRARWSTLSRVVDGWELTLCNDFADLRFMRCFAPELLHAFMASAPSSRRD